MLPKLISGLHTYEEVGNTMPVYGNVSSIQKDVCPVEHQ